MSEDPSRGYDAVAEAFARLRSDAGLGIVLRWAASLPPGASILDVGAGTGRPLATALDAEGFALWAVDAAPAMTAAFGRALPHVPIACEAAEHSPFFGRRFDAVMAIGLVFLLPEETQRALIARMARALRPGGSLLFSAATQTGSWRDTLTGRTSVSLGAAAYREAIRAAGMTLADEPDDEGGSHYYAARVALSPPFSPPSRPSPPPQPSSA